MYVPSMIITRINNHVRNEADIKLILHEQNCALLTKVILLINNQWNATPTESSLLY